MKKSFAVVITSILSDCSAIKIYSEKCSAGEIELFVVGDKKSPQCPNIDNCNYYSLNDQKKLHYKFVSKCPLNNYARKNIGYLEAIKAGYGVIVETDDDNFPMESFWEKRKLRHNAESLIYCGWLNIYSYFTSRNVWPRGFPIEFLNKEIPSLTKKHSIKYCPIQQGLTGNDPDVDAIYRMTIGQEISFIKNKKIAIGKNVWCPFNSQNTTWFKKAFPLMYLPSYCSMRLADIWRSFIAQRIAWTCGWNILYHSPNVYQERNKHNLLSDFEDEIPGYLNNNAICNALNDLDLKEGIENLYENLFRCYNLMVIRKWVGKKELKLLELWIEDIDSIKQI